MGAVVQADSKGRIRLPLEVRRKIRAKRFKISTDDDAIRLQPLPEVKELKGKYKALIRSDWEELEKRAERLVSQGKR